MSRETTRSISRSKKFYSSATIAESKQLYWLADIIVILSVIVIGFALLYFIQTGNQDFVASAEIKTDYFSLAKYAGLSLCRSLIALSISYVFALAYGSLAASSPRHERIMIPILDVLQALPVLTFLPGVVITLMALFPNSRWGLELSCILMVFTCQVWNLVFAYYQSQKTLSQELKDFAKLSKLSVFQRFFLLDLPNGLRPLIYNGMMSMAGGWFFLTLCESFTLGNKSFRLPGLGSYLGVAFAEQNYSGFCAGLAVLALIVVGVDFFVWKPLTAWVSQYSDSDNETQAKSVVLDLLHNTRLPELFAAMREDFMDWLETRRQARRQLHLLANNKKDAKSAYTATELASQVSTIVRSGASFFSGPKAPGIMPNIRTILQWAVSLSVGGLVFYILPLLPQIGKAMSTLSSADWLQLINALGRTSLKVLGVLFIGTLWTLPVGLWIGKNRKVATFAEPIIQNIAAFPAPVLFPLIVFWVHGPNIPEWLVAILLMTIGNQWYLLFNILSGTSAITKELVDVARMFNFGPWKRFTLVYFPAVFPSLVTGWISTAGGAWNASIVAEIVMFPGGSMVSNGIGAEIAMATEQGNYPRLVAAVIVTTIGLVVLNRTVWRTMHGVAERLR